MNTTEFMIKGVLKLLKYGIVMRKIMDDDLYGGYEEGNPMTVLKVLYFPRLLILMNNVMTGNCFQ